MTSSTTEDRQGCAIPRTGAPSHSGAAPAEPRRWSLAAYAGAILSAFLASACCIGPVVFALLGLGGAGLLVKFEPYRPYFMALTFALLGAGFYFTYRKPKGAAEEGDACGCPAPRANRVGRIMLWVTTIMVAGFLAFPYIAPLIWG